MLIIVNEQTVKESGNVEKAKKSFWVNKPSINTIEELVNEFKNLSISHIEGFVVDDVSVRRIRFSFGRLHLEKFGEKEYFGE